MPIDPVIEYGGPESRSIDVTVILYGGAAVAVRGVIKNAETSTGEAAQAFADAGPIAWIAFDGDPAEIEFLQYIELATGAFLHRRVTKRERTSANYNTVKVNLSSEGTTMQTQTDFLAADFAVEDFG